MIWPSNIVHLKKIAEVNLTKWFIILLLNAQKSIQNEGKGKY